jgi:hypothetical protein
MNITTRGHTTKMLYDSADYFVALTDRNCVRIGLKNAVCYDIPSGHAYYDRTVESASSPAWVEELHDELVGHYA